MYKSGFAFHILEFVACSNRISIRINSVYARAFLLCFCCHITARTGHIIMASFKVGGNSTHVVARAIWVL